MHRPYLRSKEILLVAAPDHCGLANKATCYDIYMGEYEKSYNSWLELAKLYKNEGLEVDAEMAMREAEAVKTKIR